MSDYYQGNRSIISKLEENNVADTRYVRTYHTYIISNLLELESYALKTQLIGYIPVRTGTERLFKAIEFREYQ